MKQRVIALLCAALMVCAALPQAQANGWGLKGELYKAVSAVNTWDDYTALGGQAGDAAVLTSRYHNVLLLLDPAQKGRLRAYTKAVYQPGDGRGKQLALTKTADGFTLRYGEGEYYTFFEKAGQYVLREARLGAFAMTAVNESAESVRYVASEGAATARWLYGCALNDFNISLFPRSVAQVRHLNYMLAALDSGCQYLGGSQGLLDKDDPWMTRKNIGKGTAPVYSAPFGESAWRAADGKAAVGLSGELWLLGGYTNADGQAWACIRYDVSQRTQRIGYIRATLLEADADSAWAGGDDLLIYADVLADADTYLTDDPDVSQYPQFAVPAGTRFTCHALYGRDYAYVSAEVRGGQFVAGGHIVWGFVPLKALTLDVSDGWRNDIQADVMAQLAGEWRFYGGGNQAEDILILNADGTYIGKNEYEDEFASEPAENRGTWAVTRYNPFWNLYWYETPYEITFIREDGTANVKGLALTNEGFSLIFWEGGGGYVPLTEDGWTEGGGNG